MTAVEQRPSYNAVPRPHPWRLRVWSAVLLMVISFQGVWYPAVAAGGGKPTPSSSGPSYTPMSLLYDRYYLGNTGGCLGEDDWLEWQATGTLQPGESFTYTPQVPACHSHPAAIFMALSWMGSTLELSAVVPDNDYLSWDPDQQGKRIVAPTVGNTAQLCMFPWYSADNIYYTITVTNVGSTTASNVIAAGGSTNDWASQYYKRCLNADADGDGWNDSFEHTMASLLYPLRSGGYDVPYTLWGTNYLKARSETATPDDEIDAYPPDLNDDGVVDADDVNIVASHIGEGNGIPLEDISPNWFLAESFYNNTFSWRRYDLDGDGYVSQTDVNIVASLVGQPIPMPRDVIAPTARVTAPASGEIVQRGSYYLIRGHVWDNAALAHVDYLVDGKTQCSITAGLLVQGYSPYTCWWKVPSGQGSHTIAVRAYDAAGNMTTSETVTVVGR